MKKNQIVDIPQDEDIVKMLYRQIVPGATKTYKFKSYLINSEIGNGNFATVYSATFLKENMKVAMKIIDLNKIKLNYKDKSRQKALSLVKRQKDFLAQLDSPYVIKLNQSFQNEHSLILILQYCEGETLSNYLQKKGGYLDEEVAVRIIKQISLGLYQMHSKKILHRDLKLQNIVFDKDCWKIIDLGFSRKMNDIDQLIDTTFLGTQYTMAPQILRHQPYNYKVDIFSLGVILFRLVCPNDIASIQKRIAYNFQKYKNRLKLSEQLLNFITLTTQQDQEKRADWKSVLNHPLFLKYVFQNYQNKKIRQIVEQTQYIEIQQSYSKPHKLTTIIQQQQINQIMQKKASKYSIIIQPPQDQPQRKSIQQKQLTKYSQFMCKAKFIMFLIDQLEDKLKLKQNSQTQMRSLYLLSERAFFDLSQANAYFISIKKSQLFTQTLSYQMSQTSCNYYCQKLNKITKKIGYFFKSIGRKIMLCGEQNIQNLTRLQHIQYTQTFLDKLDIQDYQLRYKCQNYYKIMNIQIKTSQCRLEFDQKLKQILGSNYSLVYL